MVNTFKKIIMVTTTLLSMHVMATSDYDEGIDYIKLEVPIETKNADKVEVRELFWYYCPHCYSLEANIERWLDNDYNAQEVDFIRHPAVYSKKWRSGSDYYYIMEDLGIVDEFNMKLFKEIHVNKNRLRTTESFLAWLNKNGIEKSRTDKYLKSFFIFVKSNRAQKTTRRYQASGVPIIIVDGKYQATTKLAGSPEKLMKIVNFLVNKSKAEK